MKYYTTLHELERVFPMTFPSEDPFFKKYFPNDSGSAQEISIEKLRAGLPTGYGQEKKIPLEKILSILGLKETLWCLFAALDPNTWGLAKKFAIQALWRHRDMIPETIPAKNVPSIEGILSCLNSTPEVKDMPCPSIFIKKLRREQIRCDQTCRTNYQLHQKLAALEVDRPVGPYPSKIFLAYLFSCAILDLFALYLNRTLPLPYQFLVELSDHLLDLSQDPQKEEQEQTEILRVLLTEQNFLQRIFKKFAKKKND